MKNSFLSIGEKIWNSIPDSDPALPKYKFKNILQSRLLDILIQEDTYVGVHTLVEIFSKYYFFSVQFQFQFNFIHTLSLLLL